MRLQLIVGVLFGASLASTSARAEAPEPSPPTPVAASIAKIDSRSSIYQDSDRTTIVTSNIAARGAPTEHFGINARYLVDVITSASVDVVTAATAAFHETRHEAEGGLEYRDDDRKISAGYVYSTENDWSSHTANAGFQQDVIDHDVTVRVAGTYVANAVGRSGDLAFRRRLSVAGATTGITFVLTPEDLLDVGYTFSYNEGYQASPYRFVAFGGAVGSRLTLSEPEVDPDVRLRHAVTVRWNRHLFTDTALRSHVRGYADDWGIKSITAGTEYVVGFGAFETGAFVRGYAQGRADFYAPQYAQPMRYMTADRELASFVDAFGGARAGWRKIRWGALDDLHVEAKLTAFVFEFSDFPRLKERSGAVGEIALGVAF